MTKTVVDDKCRDGILKVLQIGEKKYLPFRNERYVERSKKITAKISKIKPSPFQISTNDNGKDSNEKNEVTSKEIAIAQRKMDIALIRGMTKEDVLSHDLLDDTILFVDSSTSTKASKGLLVTEIEKMIDENHKFEKHSNLATHEIVDFMSCARQQKFISGETICHTVNRILENMQRVTNYDMIHVLFDSYKSLSILMLLELTIAKQSIGMQ